MAGKGGHTVNLGVMGMGFLEKRRSISDVVPFDMVIRKKPNDLETLSLCAVVAAGYRVLHVRIVGPDVRLGVTRSS